MKIKLTPELSYLIGLWRKCRSFEGLGVHARKDVLEIFSKIVIDLKLSPTTTLLSDENRVYFYHSAYRKFFQDIEKEQLDRFKYLNDYSASYLAGLFDAIGNIDDRGVVSLARINKEDELMLLRLGFHSRRKEGVLVIERPMLFLAFIRNYSKLFIGHKIFEYIEKSKSGKKKLKMS